MIISFDRVTPLSSSTILTLMPSMLALSKTLSELEAAWAMLVETSSLSSSCSAVTVTVRGEALLNLVNVRLDGDTVRSPPAKMEMVTSSVGAPVQLYSVAVRTTLGDVERILREDSPRIVINDRYADSVYADAVVAAIGAGGGMEDEVLIVVPRHHPVSAVTVTVCGEVSLNVRESGDTVRSPPSPPTAIMMVTSAVGVPSSLTVKLSIAPSLMVRDSFEMVTPLVVVNDHDADVVYADAVVAAVSTGGRMGDGDRIVFFIVVLRRPSHQQFFGGGVAECETGRRHRYTRRRQ